MELPVLVRMGEIGCVQYQNIGLHRLMHVARAGYGIFYGRTPSIMVGTAHSNNGINVQTITFTGALVPAYPNVYSALPPSPYRPRSNVAPVVIENTLCRI